MERASCAQRVHAGDLVVPVFVCENSRLSGVECVHTMREGVVFLRVCEVNVFVAIHVCKKKVACIYTCPCVMHACR